MTKKHEWACEASTGVIQNAYGTFGPPKIQMCHKPAKLIKNERAWRFPNALPLCEEHAYLAKGDTK